MKKKRSIQLFPIEKYLFDTFEGDSLSSNGNKKRKTEKLFRLMIDNIEKKKRKGKFIKVLFEKETPRNATKVSKTWMKRRRGERINNTRVKNKKRKGRQ